ncbi:MAG: DNA translocase FtsK 4TM domain-containing protein [Atribacterota bacterium]
MPEQGRKIVIVSFLGVFALYILLSFFSTSVGVIGEKIKVSFLFTLGIGAYALPFFLAYLAYEIAILNLVRRYRFIGRIIGLLLWLFIFLTLVERRAVKSQVILVDYNLGGRVGSALYSLLNRYLGESGTLLFLFLFAFLGTYLLGEGKLIRQLVHFAKSLGKKPGSIKPEKIPSDSTSSEAWKSPVSSPVFPASSIEEVFEVTSLVSKTSSPKRIKKSVPPQEVEEWILPSSRILSSHSAKGEEKTRKEIAEEIAKLEKTLAEFNVAGRVTNFQVGPTVTRYEFQPAPGVKVNKIVNLSNDIALAFAVAAVRIEAPIPGRSAVGIEIPNRRKEIVSLRELVEEEGFYQDPSPLKIALGKDVAGKPLIWDLREAPHLLIAGATGSGKSVCINTILASLLFRSDPNVLRIALIDPKKVELSLYAGLPHLCGPVISEVRLVIKFLKWLCREMDSRYELLSELSCRNVDEYNRLVEKKEQLPYVVVVIDELADLMMTAASDVEGYICRLAQMARAVGIHLVVATQRPSVDVITGLIKANFPSRLAFAVYSQVDSRTILDMPGAEKLLGNGDLLFAPIGVGKPIRGQGAFISTEETKKVVEHWSRQKGSIHYSMEFVFRDEEVEISEDEDDVYGEAVKIVMESGRASTSLLQRRLRIGFNRAARLIERMEREGIVGPYEGSKPRKVIMRRGEQ